MKIIAYVAIDYRYFARLLPQLKKSAEVFPLVVLETLSKLGGPAVTPEEWRQFWNFLLDQEQPDAIWCYALPDEITLAVAARHRLPVLIQEYYGHQPHNLTGILPYAADWNACYQHRSPPTLLPPARQREWPVITLSLSEAFYPADETIAELLRTYRPGGASPRYLYWYPNAVAADFTALLKLVMELCRSNDRLRGCPLRVRPHPRYPEAFAAIADAVETADDPSTAIDRSPAAEALAETDIVVHVNSNYGFDAVRCGAEVISAGGFAFFDNPLYTRSVHTATELSTALTSSVRKIREYGKIPPSFLPWLLQDLEPGGSFFHPCLEPYPDGLLATTLQQAGRIPLLPLPEGAPS